MEYELATHYHNNDTMALKFLIRLSDKGHRQAPILKYYMFTKNTLRNDTLLQNGRFNAFNCLLLAIFHSTGLTE